MLSPEEINAKADQAVEMFQYNGEFIDSVRMSEETATQCAILMYEGRVKLNQEILKLSLETITTNSHSTSRSIESKIMDKLSDNQAILNNLKERV